MFQVINLSKLLKGDGCLFEISFSLAKKEKVGLIGPNGSGKTTLLKIIMGEVEAEGGKVIRDKNIKLAYLPQVIQINSSKTVGEYFQQQLKKDYPRFLGLIKGTGFSATILQKKCDHLSEGEKVKLMILKLLAGQPNCLLLDEPTNNLDMDGLNFVCDQLKRFNGALLLVSHDRWLLDQIVTKIISLEDYPQGRRAVIYRGNYSSYKHQKLLEEEKKIARIKDQEVEIKKLKETLRTVAIKAQQTAKNFSKDRQKKKVGIMDLSKSRKVNRQVGVLEEKLLTLEENLETVPKVNLRWWQFDSFLPRGQRVLEAKNLSFSFPNQLIVNNLNFALYGQDRIALISPNGSGKSTLLKIFLQEIKNYQGEIKINSAVRIGYLPQEVSFENEELDLDHWIANYSLVLELSEWHKILGRLGISQKKQGLKIKDLSIGEKRKLYLAKMVAERDNALFLDEPTNHLDLDSIEILEGALSNFGGAMLIVSHDRYFLKNVKIASYYSLSRGTLKEILDFNN